MKKPLQSCNPSSKDCPMRLWKHKNGYWYIEFRRGLQRSLKTKNHKTAKIIYRKLEKEWLRGRLLHLDKPIPLKDFIGEFLKTKEHTAPKTYRQYDLALRLFMEVVGENTNLYSINRKKIEQFRNVCLGRKVKPVSVNSYLGHIKAALNAAEDWYPNFTRPKWKKCKIEKHLPRYLSPREINSLLSGADEKLYPFLVFYLWTGCRRIEALRLRWEDINFGVKKTTARITGKGNKERIVPLPKPVCDVLNSIKKDIGTVFEQVHPDTLTHRFRRLARSCGIKARLHDLRHSAATYMLNCGTPIEIVRKILGHAWIQTTEQYTTVFDETIFRELKLDFKEDPFA